VEIYTIGFTQTTAEHFFGRLKAAGIASLGILRLRRRPEVVRDKFGKLRLRLGGAGKPAYLPIGDLRFVEADHATIKPDVVADVNARMRRGVEVHLMLGLARAFRRSDDDDERHWLQVNGICLADRPLGEEP
jgi:hypothetical protein